MHAVGLVLLVVALVSAGYGVGEWEKGLCILRRFRGSRAEADEVVLDIKRNTLSGAVGAVLLFPALALLLTGPIDGARACTIVDDAPAGDCGGHIRDDFGTTATLTVTEPGTFTVRADNPLAWVGILDAHARPIATNAPGAVTRELAPGTYTILVRDSMLGHAQRLPGGLPYRLSVARATPAISLR